ncbi:MAG: aminoglycoside phosphotransferase family protein [Conexibacter sp.]
MQQQNLQKIAEGREAEIFAWGDGAVLRLLRNPNARQQIEWEAAAMRATASSGVRVPAVREIVEVDGRPGLVMERVEGKDMLAIVGRKPWLVWSIGTTSGRLHAELNGVVAPEGLPWLRERMRQRIERSNLVPPHIAERALAELDGLPDGDKVCHGDLHPGNIMQTDSAPVIIDWTNVARGDPTADYVRTLLMIRMGSIPPGSPIVIRVGARFARRLILIAYERAYRRQRPIDAELVARWEGPVAAVRLTENIEPEREKLLRMLEGS